MTAAEQIAITILSHDALAVRSLVQDWLRSAPIFANEPAPASTDARVRVVAAAVTELLAERAGQRAPAWTATVEHLAAPIYLVAAADRSPKLRARVERESPDALRRHNVFAPPGYLDMR